MIGQFLSGQASHYRHVELEHCGSTNAECLNAAESGDPGNLWITALSQSAGRGSRGRSWISETGNLHASLLLLEPCEKRHLPQLTFVAAVALRNTILDILPSGDDLKIDLKWPNDVLLNGRKVSGILLESTDKAGIIALTIGIGINCKQYPTDTLFPATSLAENGCTLELRDVFESLTGHVAGAISQWRAGDNFAAIRNQWLGHAAGLGKEIKVQLPGQETLVGVFQAIDEHGILLLKTPDGEIKKISVGDVFFNVSFIEE
ncbi:MAG: biotin--[acetyl-CoA-carboxylase] ligase [Rhizobiaceae bacterium]